FGVAILAISLPTLLFLRSILLVAGLSSLLAWFVLGICGAAIVHQPQPKDYIVSVIHDGTIDIHSPLRGHGTLRDEPATLPWGISYELALSHVDFQDRSVPVRGGL